MPPPDTDDAGRPGKDGHAQTPDPDNAVVPIETGKYKLAPEKFGVKGFAPSTVWSYVDAQANCLGAVARYEAGTLDNADKSFRQFRCEHGRYILGLNGKKLPLYRLPDLNLDPMSPVYWVEGERCTDAVVSLGFMATTTPGGAKSFKPWLAARPEDLGVLEGRVVLVLADNDDPGREYARVVAAALHGAGADVRIADPYPWADLGPGADVADWIESGATRSDLSALLDSASRYEPQDGDNSGSNSARSLQSAESLQDEDLPADFDRGSDQKTLLIEIAAELKMFHDARGVAFAVVPVRDFTEVVEIKSRVFRSWLSKACYSTHGIVPAGGALTDVIQLLEGIARTECEQHETHIRLALHGDRIYYDLADSERRVVEIYASDWRFIKNPPVYFRRSRGQKAQVAPQRGGNVELMRKFINADENAVRLVLMFIIASLRPGSNYPILYVTGEHGSAKSMLLRLIGLLVDPHIADVRKPPTCDRDLYIAANGAWLLSFDNVSIFKPWLSDAACTVATGSALTTRELYSDYDETILKTARPQAYNGIEPFATHGDFLDRAWSVTLKPISSGSRRTEAEVLREFEQVRPFILGALFDAVAGALSRLNSVKLPGLPRMADATLWCAAAAPTLGWPDGTVFNLLEALNGDHETVALEADFIAELTLAFWREREKAEWTGKPSELLKHLRNLAGADVKHLPERANGLKGRLMRAAPLLRRNGCEVVMSVELPGGKRNGITLTATKHPPSGSEESAMSVKPLEAATSNATNHAADNGELGVQLGDQSMPPELAFDADGADPSDSTDAAGDALDEDGG